MHRSLRVLALAGAFLCASAAVVLAQDATTTVVTAAPGTTVTTGTWFSTYVQPGLSTLFGAVVTAAITWAAAALAKFTGVNVEQKYRDSVHSAAMTGINLAMSQLAPKLDNLTIDVKSQVVAHAVQWMVNSVPDAISHLGVTPDALIALAESKLSALMNAQTTTASTTAAA